MKRFKFMLPVLMCLLCNQCLAGASGLMTDTKNQAEDRTLVQEASQGSALFLEFNLQAQIKADEALQALCEYMKLPSGHLDKGKKFATAVKRINEAIDLDKDNPDYYFLAARIYRSKAGVVQAQRHFRKGCWLLEQRLAANPLATNFYLEYGIAMVCGDAKHWEDRVEYEQQGLKAAQRGLEMLPQDTGSPELLYQRALFKLLLGDQDSCDGDFELLKRVEPPEWYLQYYDEYKLTMERIANVVEMEKTEEDKNEKLQNGLREYLSWYLYDTSRHISIDYGK